MRWRHRKAVPDGWRDVCAAEVRGDGAGQRRDGGLAGLGGGRRSGPRVPQEKGLEVRKLGHHWVAVWGLIYCVSN